MKKKPVKNKKKILIFTATRAEYGLFRPIIKKAEKFFDIRLLVGGTHISPEDGFTINEILEDGVDNIRTIPFLLASRTPGALCVSVGNGLIQMSAVLEDYKPDFIMVLGDRYEIFIPVIAAVLHNIPVIHIHGGEITEGVIDEQIRHAVTKMSHVHFVSSPVYADNVSRMGEEDWRIFVIGAPGLDNIRRIGKKSVADIKKRIGVDLSSPTMICTYHPVTISGMMDIETQVHNLVKALSSFDGQVIFTRPNAEVGSEIIVRKLKEAVHQNQDRFSFFDSLGTELYHNVVRHCVAVIGNSSSGIIEAPFHKVPTVNIGERQKGRLHPPSVIESGLKTAEIRKSIQKALDDDFQKSLKDMVCPFGDGKAGDYALASLKQVAGMNTIDLLQKKLDFDVNPEKRHKFWS